MGNNRAGRQQRIHAAERELDQAIMAWRRETNDAGAGAVRISKQVRVEQKKLRRSLLAHIRSIGVLFWLTGPVRSEERRVG